MNSKSRRGFIPKKKAGSESRSHIPTTSTASQGKAKGTGWFNRFSRFFRDEAGVAAEPSRPFFEKDTLYASILFALFILAMLWSPLTHPGSTPGGFDMTGEVPFRWLWIESLKNFKPVFWDPYSSLGQPFLAMASPGAYAPFNFLFFLIQPISYAFTWIYVIHFFMAALFTYLFIRGLGCGWKSACMGALAFTFSGFFMGHYFWGHPNMVWAAQWMPMYLYGLQRYVNRRAFSGLFLAAVAMGLSILEGMPQINMYEMIIGGLWLGWAWLGRKINWKELLGAEAILIFLSFSIGLCQMAPSYQFAHLSVRWTWHLPDILTDVFLPQYFHFFINPFFQGGPGHGDYQGTWGYQEVVAYIGLAPLFLAVAGFFRLMFKRPLVWWFALVALWGTVLAMADSTKVTFYIFLFFYKFLPGFCHNRSVSRILLLTEFALSCLAAMGLEAWMDYWRRKFPPGWARKLLTQWIPLAVLVLTAVDLGHFAWVNTSSHGSSYDYHSYWVPGRLMDAQVIKMARDDTSWPRVQPESTADADYEIIEKVPAVVTGYPTQIEWTTRFLREEWENPETPLPDLIRLTYRWRPDSFIPTERWRPIPGFPAYWTDSKAFPRAFMVGGYDVNPDFNNAICDIRDGKVDPREEVVLAQEPADEPKWQKGWLGEAKITKYDWNELEIECSNDRP
jgi:hypothetical protein